MRITESENISDAINDTIVFDGGSLGNPDDMRKKAMCVECKFIVKRKRDIEYETKHAVVNLIVDTIWQKLYERYRKNESDNAILVGLDGIVLRILMKYCREKSLYLMRWDIINIVC